MYNFEQSLQKNARILIIQVFPLGILSQSDNNKETHDCSSKNIFSFSFYSNKHQTSGNNFDEDEVSRILILYTSQKLAQLISSSGLTSLLKFAKDFEFDILAWVSRNFTCKKIKGYSA